MTTATQLALDTDQEGTTARLVAGIMEKKPRLGELLRLTAVPFWFDAPLVAALRGKEDGQEENVISLLDQYSFVHSGYGRYWYSADMRAHLLAQWVGDEEDLAAAHARALAHFRHRLVKAPPADPALYEEMVAAYLYHLLGVDEADGTAQLVSLVEQAAGEYRTAAAEKYLRVAEERRSTLSAGTRAAVDYLHGCVMQSRGQWVESGQHFEALIERDDLPGLIGARVHRALARSLIELGQPRAAIARNEHALALFQQAKDAREAGLTMAWLGNSYLNLALTVWGSGWMRRPSPRSRLWLAADLGHLLVRVPLVLYLMWHLGFRALLPGVLRTGSDVDWIVARILTTTADWFRRAEEALRGSDAPTALVEVWEGQAQLYRVLGCLGRAEALNQRIVEVVPPEGYRAARARLGLAECLLLQARAGEAAETLEELVPVFVRFGHRRRVAQAQTLLGTAEGMRGRYEQAIARYHEAFESWRAIADRVAVTDVVEEMEAIAARRSLPAASQETVTHAAGEVAERHYPVRYNHPVITRFAAVSLVALVVLFFFTVRLALRSEWGTVVDPTVRLVRPTLRSIPESEEMNPQVTLTIEQQLRPSPPVEAVGTIVVAALAGYALLYTAVGSYLIARIPISQIEPDRVRTVVIQPEGMGGPTRQGAATWLSWREARALVRSDRAAGAEPIKALSFFALFARGEPLVVNAFTYHYRALQRQVACHLPPGVRVHDLGFSLLHSKSGWIFMASLTYVLSFFVIAVLFPDLVVQNVPPIPYNAVDLYWLAYLGIAFPLVWWFAVQPLRAHWLVSPQTPLVWIVGAAGLVLALFSLVQLFAWHLPLGRPDVTTALLASVLVSLAGAHVLRARLPDALPGRGLVYSRAVRLGTAAITGVTLAAMLVAIGWELLSFHYLATGNTALRHAEALRAEAKPAEVLYTRALNAYAWSRWLRPEPYIDNSRGAIYARLGRNDEALVAYAAAWKADPAEPTYQINEALVYHSLATAADARQEKIDLYGDTIQGLSDAIESMAGRPGRYHSQLITARLLRGSAYYDRGQEHLTLRDRAHRRGDDAAAAGWHANAMDDFEQARQDYEWLTAEVPGEAAGYAGRGWVTFRLRELATSLEQERQELRRAIDYFWAALARNPDEISARIGLGWAQFYYATGYPACADGEGDPEGADHYRSHLESAVQAYSGVIAREDAAIHYRVRAQLEFLLRDCDGVDKWEKLKEVRTLYDEAIARDGARASWYLIRGNLWYAFAGRYKGAERAAARERAQTDYDQAVTVDPGCLACWQKLVDVAKEWGEHDREIDGYLGIVAHGSERDISIAYWRLGWLTYLYRQDYPASLEYSARALALDRDLAPVHFNKALVYVVLGDVEPAVQSYLDGVLAAERVRSGRKKSYNAAIDDLYTAHADPAGVAPGFVALLTAARDGQSCTPLEQPGYGLLLLPRPGAGAEEWMALVLEDDRFLPGGLSADGAWVYGVVESTEQAGWLNANPALLTCAFDARALPVVDPAHLVGAATVGQ